MKKTNSVQNTPLPAKNKSLQAEQVFSNNIKISFVQDMKRKKSIELLKDEDCLQIKQILALDSKPMSQKDSNSS